MLCCETPAFDLLEELGHAESVDWDLGRCGSCGSYLLRQWSEYAADKVFYDKLSERQGEQFTHTRGHDRISLLKAWYNDH